MSKKIDFPTMYAAIDANPGGTVTIPTEDLVEMLAFILEVRRRAQALGATR